MESPTSISVFAISPTATGGRLGTRTVKLCWALRPPGSAARTVTSALPGLTAVTVTMAPDPVTVAIPTSELHAL